MLPHFKENYNILLLFFFILGDLSLVYNRPFWVCAIAAC